MSGFKEYDRYDGLGLAELVKKKEISSVELCEEAIARIEKINLNANGGLPPGPWVGFMRNTIYI